MSSDCMNAEMLCILLRRVANPDPNVHRDAFNTLLNQKLRSSVYIDAAEVLASLMIQAHMYDRLAFFRLHRIAVIGNIRLPFMIQAFDLAAFWPAEVLAYGIAVNSSDHAADCHFMELLSRQLRYHGDAAVRFGAEFMLKAAALSHTKGRTSVWKHEYLDEIFGR